MGATLADGGVNPVTKVRVVDPTVCHYALAVMATAGLYETSGDWLYEIGLPGKSGIGGGIVTVSPGKGGLGTFAPPLDAEGNSVKGQLVAKYLSQQLGMRFVRVDTGGVSKPRRGDRALPRPLLARSGGEFLILDKFSEAICEPGPRIMSACECCQCDCSLGCRSNRDDWTRNMK